MDENGNGLLKHEKRGEEIEFLQLLSKVATRCLLLIVPKGLGSSTLLWEDTLFVPRGVFEMQTFR